MNSSPELSTKAELSTKDKFLDGELSDEELKMIVGEIVDYYDTNPYTDNYPPEEHY